MKKRSDLGYISGMSFIAKMIIKITNNDKIKTLNLPLLIKQSNGTADNV